MPTPNPHHKRRHLKKLKLGEFREDGFAVSAQCPSDWDASRRDAAMWELLAFIDSRHLSFGGGDSADGMDGYVGPTSGRSANEEDREAVKSRMEALGFKNVAIQPLSDAWYAEDEAE